MTQNFPIAITREQFQAIAPLLENARKSTQPRVLDL